MLKQERTELWAGKIILQGGRLPFSPNGKTPLPVPSHLRHGRGVEAEFVEVVPAFDVCFGRDGQGAQDFLCEFKCRRPVCRDDILVRNGLPGDKAALVGVGGVLL